MKNRSLCRIGTETCFSRLYKISGIHGCRKIPDIYSFVTMGMIMGLRLVVLYR